MCPHTTVFKGRPFYTTRRTHTHRVHEGSLFICSTTGGQTESAVGRGSFLLAISSRDGDRGVIGRKSMFWPIYDTLGRVATI